MNYKEAMIKVREDNKTKFYEKVKEVWADRYDITKVHY